MQVREYTSSNVDREILAYMIHKTEVLGPISSQWDNGFDNDAFCLLGNLTVDFYRKQKKAPREGLVSVMGVWHEHHPQDHRADQAWKLIRSLNEQFGQNGHLGITHVLDLARHRFNEIKIRRLSEAINGDILAGDWDKAGQRIKEHRRSELGGCCGTWNFTDRETLLSDLSHDNQQAVVNYEGDLGRFFGSYLRRGKFVVFFGPEKSGKSWWLQDVAYRAMCQRRKVVFIEVGDMSRADVQGRFAARAASHPIRSKDGQWPCSVNWPTAIVAPPRQNTEGFHHATVQHEVKTFDEPLHPEAAWTAYQSIQRNCVRSKHGFLYTLVYPTMSVTVGEIGEQLDRLQNEDDFHADVVVLDYADLLAAPAGMDNRKDMINQQWAELRALSLDRDCLLVTASQSDANSYERWLLDKSNFSNAKEKLAHPNVVLGINVFGEEKALGLCRLNILVGRETEYVTREVVHVAGCLALGNPAVLSSF